MNLLQIGEAISRIETAAKLKGKRVTVDWIESGLKPDDYNILSSTFRGLDGMNKTIYGRELHAIDHLNSLPNVR